MLNVFVCLVDVFFYSADCFLVVLLYLSLLRFASVVDKLRVASGVFFVCGFPPPSNDGIVSFVFMRQRLKKSSRSLFVVGGLSSADA